jgi:hypothetical protein
MNIAYCFPKPSHALADESAGDAVRARALLAALGKCGNRLSVVEGRASKVAAVAASGYRSTLRSLLPRPLALAMRDVVRVPISRRLGARLAEAARELDADAIVETHDALSLAGVEASRASGLPLIIDDVAPPLEAAHFAGIGAAAIHRRVFQRLITAAHRLIAVNRTMEARLAACGVDPERIVRIENGVDLARYAHRADRAELRRAHGIPADNVIISFVGSFQRYHGAELLIEALESRAAGREETVLMIGDGPKRPEVEAAAGRIAGRDVRFLGRIDNDAVPAWLALTDIAVLPATNDYGNPMKLYEYLAAGTAIVAPDQETVREIVEDARTGLLFAPRDVRQLAAAIDRLCDDRELRTRLRAGSREAARQHSWEKRAERLVSAVGEIASH